MGVSEETSVQETAALVRGELDPWQTQPETPRASGRLLQGDAGTETNQDQQQSPVHRDDTEM